MAKVLFLFFLLAVLAPALAKRNPICLLSADPGTCSQGIQNYYSDSRVNMCKPFVYGGGGGNKNYYFDSRVNMCKPFVYGGCGGNKNNFVTGRQCEDFCKDV